MLSELENMIGKNYSDYRSFANEITTLETIGALTMVKSKGRNGNKPSLAYQYRINRVLLNEDYHRELENYRLKLNNQINIDKYFHMDEYTWNKDLPYIEKIHSYLENNGIPTVEAAAPERSFELVGDEKWITDKGGKEILERIGLWDKLRVFPVSDPLMLAINPHTIHQKMHYHLIIENKTTYQGLLPMLIHTDFSTLIYGSGNKIAKSIENFPNQYPVEGEHAFFYFGDIDRSGITIWFSLNKRQQVLPAVPFYKACLEKGEAFGKTNQRPDEEALHSFLTYFPDNLAEQIRNLLGKGAYYPQEVLKTRELQCIWEETEWKQILISRS